MLHIRRLQQAGYPFPANDLDIEEWEDLGSINELIAKLNQPQMVGLMPGSKGKA